jgi:hypothetical protein
MMFKVNTEAAVVAASRVTRGKTGAMRAIAAGNLYALGTASLHRDGGAVVLNMDVRREKEGEHGHAEAKLYRDGLVALRDEINRLLEEGVANG